MKEVNKEYYYHICTNNNLKVGDTLIVGNAYNPFYNNMYNVEYLKEDGTDANMILLDMFKNKELSFNSLEDFNVVRKTVNDTAMITRELMFEEERIKVNDKLPSRLKCLFIIKEDNELNTWLDIFNRAINKEYRILKLELTGNIFCGDASLVLRQNISLNKKKQQANKYWNSHKSDSPILEYLFDGTVKVIEEIQK